MLLPQVATHSNQITTSWYDVVCDMMRDWLGVIDGVDSPLLDRTPVVLGLILDTRARQNCLQQFNARNKSESMVRTT